jgi:hypothetical protein
MPRLPRHPIDWLAAAAILGIGAGLLLDTYLIAGLAGLLN